MSRPGTGGAGAPAVVFDGVRVVRERRTILDVPRLALPADAVTVLFGPNGGGKTTMLRLIAGLERPDAGVVRLAAGAGGRRDGVAYGFQEPVFLRGTVRMNLELGLTLRKVPPMERVARVRAAADECGIGHLLERDARTLSVGEAQRANLARALALGAPITLLDEPLAAFDRVGRVAFLDELAVLLRRRAGTVVLVTHDREEALRLGDHMVVLVAGRVRAAGPLRAVLERPPDPETAELLGYTVVVDGRGVTLGIPPGALRIPRGAVPLAPGARCFRFRVERVLEVGLETRVRGRILTPAGEVATEIALLAGDVPPVPGEVLEVSAAGCVAIGS